MELSPRWVTVLPSRESFRRFLQDSRAIRSSGAIEFRFDLWDSPLSLAEICAIAQPKVIAWKPGLSRESERLRYLKDAIAGHGGKLWIDLDVDDPAALRNLSLNSERSLDVQVILSRHLEEPQSDAAIRGAARDLLRPGVDAGKLVLANGGVAATGQALRISSEFGGPRPVVMFAASKMGTASRFLALANGQSWAYGRLAGCVGTAEGQPVVQSIPTRYGGGLQGDGQSWCAVIGGDVTRSISPGFHNRVLTAANHRERWVDFSLDTPDGIFERAVGSYEPPRCLAVTAPHKIWARGQGRAGAAGEERHPSWNTLLHEEGDVLGWNTDVPALVRIFSEHEIPFGEKILIIGSGGVAQPIALELAARGGRVSVLPRIKGRLPKCLIEGSIPEAGPEEIERTEILINASGLGSISQDRLRWPIDRFRGGWAIDYSYEPKETDFLKLCAGHGAKSIDGSLLFAEQARIQASIFYGIDVSREMARQLTDEALEEIAYDQICPPAADQKSKHEGHPQ